jgi:hypothetical protein
MTRRRRWVERFARAGFAAKGAVYLVVGGLALRVALGDGGQLTDASGAVAWLMTTAYGRPLVGAVAAGLTFYAIWRFLEAFADANNKGTGRAGLAARAIYAISGCVYAALAVDATRLALSVNTTAGGTYIPRTLIGSELARWAAMLIGLGLGGYGVAQLWRAKSSTLSDRLSLRAVEHDLGPWLVRVCRFGIAARAVTLMVMGIVLVTRAERSANAAAETDTGDSLRLLTTWTTGDVFQFIHARYRVIAPP